jgi:hypothetical protein
VTESIPHEDTHPQLADKSDPRETDPRGACKPNTVTRWKRFRHAGKGLAGGVFSSTLGGSAVAGLSMPSDRADRDRVVMSLPVNFLMCSGAWNCQGIRGASSSATTSIESFLPMAAPDGFVN